MAKSFSNRYVDYLLEKVRNCKPSAADYISSIEDIRRYVIVRLPLEGEFFTS